MTYWISFQSKLYCNRIWISFHHRIRRYRKLHTGCLTLSKTIKHQTDSHQLNQMSDCKLWLQRMSGTTNNVIYLCTGAIQKIIIIIIIRTIVATQEWNNHCFHNFSKNKTTSSDAKVIVFLTIKLSDEHCQRRLSREWLTAFTIKFLWC